MSILIKNKEEQKKLMELFFRKQRNGIRPKTIDLKEVYFEELVKVFKKQLREEIRMEKRGNYVDIYTLSGTLHIRLRSDQVPYPTLVIASFTIKGDDNQRTEENFFNWLKKFSTQTGFQRLMLENCHSNESTSFARKYGFLPLYQQTVPGLDFIFEESYEMYLDASLIKQIR
ncbi:hypothetical protein SPD48_08550 [Pseudogracilibacillus sp. SE30717A]|uniref:hypothetical protein n=1 Tax=Pseudogracilibacillus sp. SE30717A TaxID=3098293 RepID=UPI00300E2283